MTVLITVFLLCGSAGYARAQTTSMQSAISDLIEKVQEIGRQLKIQVKNLKDTIHNIRTQRAQMKAKADENKRKMQKIREQNRTNEVEVKHQQQDARVKMKEIISQIQR